MSLVTILIISFGVAMDAMAVSFSCGISFDKNKKLAQAFKMALAFGLFQVLMPVIGWVIGIQLKKYIEAFDHWIAFIILAVIGGKMIYESLKKEDCKSIDINSYKILLFLAVATSIDALMVGVGFSVLNVGISVPVIAMGIITFIMSFTGALVGDRMGCRFGKKVEILGGVVLIIIGLKIFWEHVKG